MQKLYIIEFYPNKGEEKTEFEWVWSCNRKEEQIFMELISEHPEMENLTYEDNCVNVYCVDEAVHRDDILNAIGRHVVKPIKRN